MAINHEEVGELDDRVVYINRVAKVVKGGRRFSFSALVVVGDEPVTSASASARPTRCPRRSARATSRREEPVQDPADQAARSRTRCRATSAPAQVLLRPAAPGTGVIAGGACARSLEVAGIQDILTKCIGTSNPHNVVHATIDALKAAAHASSRSRKTRGKNAGDFQIRREPARLRGSQPWPCKLKVTLIRSGIDRPDTQKRTHRAASGCRGPHTSVVLEDTAASAA